MKRLFSLLAFLIVIAVSSHAEDANAMRLKLSSGKDVVFFLESEPCVMFDGIDVIVTSVDGRMTLAGNDVQSYSLCYLDPSAVDRVTVAAPRFAVTTSSLSMDGLSPSSPVQAFSPDGRCVAEGKADASGHISLPLSSAPSGVYLIKTSIANFKIPKP